MQCYKENNERILACGGSYFGPSGTITSPNYPDDYPYNLDCEYYVEVESVKVRFTHINIQTREHTHIHSHPHTHIHSHPQSQFALGQLPTRDCGMHHKNALFNADLWLTYCILCFEKLCEFLFQDYATTIHWWCVKLSQTYRLINILKKLYRYFNFAQISCQAYIISTKMHP